MKHLGDLGKNYLQRIEQENKKLKQIAENQELTLRRELKAETQKILTNYRKESETWLNQELNIISHAMEENNRTLKKYLGKQSLWLLVGGGSLCLGILGGSLGMMHYLSNQITSRVQTLDHLNQQINTQQNTLNHLKQETKGIQIYQSSNGTFITPPPWKTLTPGWKCHGESCWKME